MTEFAERLACFRDDQSGATMIEYSVLLGIVGLATLGMIMAVSVWVQESLGDVAEELNKAGKHPCPPSTQTWQCN